MTRLFVLFSCALLVQGYEGPGDSLRPWSGGMLDIHQIQTGRGNAAYLIFPDGTTMLIDAGEVPDKVGSELGPRLPNSSKSVAEWLAEYIRQFSPRKPASLDYALITHFHNDHMGAIAELSRLVPIRTLIDRGNTPPGPAGSLLRDYLQFRQSFTGNAEILQPGKNRQILAIRGGAGVKDFEIRNLAANGTVWTGVGESTLNTFPEGWQMLPKEEQPTENGFSLALLIRYGNFKYYTGGDLPGIALDGLPGWHDLESPIARAIGQVSVAVLNHHGWLDTTNPFFLQTLQPRVVIIPAWHATHPDHGVVRRLLQRRIFPGPRDIFVTSLLDAPRTILSYLGPVFASTEGHVLVRVEPGGSTYRVIVLEDSNAERRIRSVHGPYRAK